MTSTTTRAGFTSRGVTVNCRGTHHHDTATLGTCDGCHWPVARLANGKVVNTYRGRGDESVNCWAKPHECDPELRALVVAEKEERIATGAIEKGQTVTVVKGRKVPVGTTGTVFWVGTDNYGNDKVGLRTADGDKHFTAMSNVQATA